MPYLAKFNIGDVVLHKQQGYRAVIVDVDPIFQASGQYNPQASQRAFAHRNPWYRLLVDNSRQVTYVEESALLLELNLETKKNSINNPLIKEFSSRRLH
ncbi:MAG: heat shock protein HspQ [Gammaproteobacteria bacterium]|nr:heat shock protein HspQ [Gammaproteobacteria bacterium]MCH9716405.1 heat shock protein HspQ [Gammaproteobacteria bacterium]MCH9763141.1 heat shock protein HspQ [Gammaproteobacteria bacterium]